MSIPQPSALYGGPLTGRHRPPPHHVAANRVGVVLLGVLAIIGWGIGVHAGQTDAPPVTIHEEDPGWDCATMGNQICGPVSPPVEHQPVTSGYEDERWQDPSGLPYCGVPVMRPCVDAQTSIVFP